MELFTHEDSEGCKAFIYQSIFPEHMRDKPMEELQDNGMQDVIALITKESGSLPAEVWTGKRGEFDARFTQHLAECPKCKAEVSIHYHMICSNCFWRGEFIGKRIATYLKNMINPPIVRTIQDWNWLEVDPGENDEAGE